MGYLATWAAAREKIISKRAGVYSNSEQDMKYPQRGQTILQRRFSRRVEQTGQNWLGNSGGDSEPAGLGASASLIALSLTRSAPS
jgi:hypothetical protein